MNKADRAIWNHIVAQLAYMQRLAAVDEAVRIQSGLN
jgi:hypothetical protein